MIKIKLELNLWREIDLTRTEIPKFKLCFNKVTSFFWKQRVIDEFLTFVGFHKKQVLLYLMPLISWQILIIKEMSDISAQIKKKDS